MALVRRGIPALVAAAAFAALAGCGGGGGSSSANFVADGNRICKEDNAKFRNVKPPSGSDTSRYYKELAPLVERVARFLE